SGVLQAEENEGCCIVDHAIRSSGDQVFPYLLHLTRTNDQAPIAILVHEYVITFIEEVDRMWYSTFQGPRMSWNWASFFFYLNRYLVLFSHGPVIMEFFWTTSNHHDKLQLPRPPIIPSIFSDRHSSDHFLRRVLALLVGLAIGAVAFGCVIGLSLWSVLGGKDRVPEIDQVFPVGCADPLTRVHIFGSSMVSMTHFPDFRGIHFGAAWGGMLIFDTVVFGMTVLKSLTLRLKGQDLISVLLRDGTLTIGPTDVPFSNIFLYLLSLGAIYFRCFFLGSPAAEL
ncbi:hypothetical protein K443DRAFT_96358, partial [Laccaria amethystina LaAM-08-1]